MVSEPRCYRCGSGNVRCYARTTVRRPSGRVVLVLSFTCNVCPRETMKCIDGVDRKFAPCWGVER